MLRYTRIYTYPSTRITFSTLSLTEHDKHEKIAQILRRHAAKYLQQLLGVELLVLVLKHQLVVKLVVGLRTSNVILTERGWVGGEEVEN